MQELEFYVCHAGQGIEQYEPEPDNMGVGELGVIGCVYVFRGVYIRSPDECINNDKMEIMELESLANRNICWGSLDSFSQIDSTFKLINWANKVD